VKKKKKFEPRLKSLKRRQIRKVVPLVTDEHLE
jgi:hypothetical protein